MKKNLTDYKRKELIKELKTLRTKLSETKIEIDKIADKLNLAIMNDPVIFKLFNDDVQARIKFRSLETEMHNFEKKLKSKYGISVDKLEEFDDK